jgi:hypothetical protein
MDMRLPFFSPLLLAREHRHRHIMAAMSLYLSVGTVGILAILAGADGPEPLSGRAGRAVLDAGIAFVIPLQIGWLFGAVYRLPGQAENLPSTLLPLADWATKMILGAVIAIAVVAPASLSSLGSFFALGASDDPEARRLGLLVVSYFAGGGLLIGFMIARFRQLEIGARPEGLDQGLELALTLPLDCRRWKGLTVEQNRWIETVVHCPRDILQNPLELRGWARIQLALGNPFEAMKVYNELEQADPNLLKTEMEQARHLFEARTNQKEESDFPSSSDGRGLLPSEAINRMFQLLYKSPPQGFREAIDMGEMLATKIQSGQLMAYLACAYGQQHAFLGGDQARDRKQAQNAADRALFCVQQALDLDPAWRPVLRACWNPASPGADNDLASLHGDARFAAVLDPDNAPKPAAINAEDIRAAFTRPAGSRYSGKVAAWLVHKDGGKIAQNADGAYEVAPNAPLRLVVQFYPDGAEPEEPAEAIKTEGEDQPGTEFVVQPDAADIPLFTPDSLAVVAPRDAVSPQPDFSFVAPEAGEHEMWIQISQAGRAAQVLKVVLAVR